MAVSAATSLLRLNSRWQTACAQSNPSDSLQEQVSTSKLAARERYCLGQHYRLNAAGWVQEGKQDASGGRRHLKSSFFPHGWASACSPSCQTCWTAFTGIAPEMSKSPLSLPAQTFPWEHKPGQSDRLSCPSIPPAVGILKQCLRMWTHSKSIIPSLLSQLLADDTPKKRLYFNPPCPTWISVAVLTHIERHCGCWKGSELFPSREGSAVLTVTAQGHLYQGGIKCITSYWSGTALCFGLPISQLKDSGGYKSQELISNSDIYHLHV